MKNNVPIFIIGIDEVGRGAMAGPLVVGATCLPQNYPLNTYCFDQKNWSDKFLYLQFIRDSKKIIFKKREQVVEIIKTQKIQNIILKADNNLIDKFGLGLVLNHLFALSLFLILFNLENTKSQIEIYLDGKQKIIRSLNQDLTNSILLQNNVNPDIIKQKAKSENLLFESTQNITFEELFDRFINFKLETRSLVCGDDKILAIAMASNLAKVYRDNLMIDLSLKFPQFGWDKNKGYGTKKHRQEIAKNKNNTYLRQSFIKF
jgi:ribonuclease HII